MKRFIAAVAVAGCCLLPTANPKLSAQLTQPLDLIDCIQRLTPNQKAGEPWKAWGQTHRAALVLSDGVLIRRSFAEPTTHERLRGGVYAVWLHPDDWTVAKLVPGVPQEPSEAALLLAWCDARGR